MEAASEEAELFLVSGDKTTNYVLVVCIREALSAVQDVLRRFGFTAISFNGESVNAKEATAQAERRLETLASEKEAVRSALTEKAPCRDDLKLAADVAASKLARAEAENKLMGMESTVVMQGWIPAEKEAELSGILEKYGCAWETEDPDPEEYPDVPIQLKNNKFSDALNMVTNMYSLPAYDGVDPNPLMAPFFIIFFGLIQDVLVFIVFKVIGNLFALDN